MTGRHATTGIPIAEASVIVVGIVELVAAGLLLSNRFPRFGAALAVLLMVVAAFAAGPPWQHLVLLGMVVGHHRLRDDRRSP